MRLLKLIPLALLGLSMSVFADQNTETQTFKQMLTQAAYVSSTQETIWPGFNLKPIILLFNDTQNVYAFNQFVPTRASWWQKGEEYYDTWKKASMDNIDYFVLPEGYNKNYALESMWNSLSPNDFSQIRRIDNQDTFVYVVRSDKDADKLLYHRFLTYEMKESKGFKSSFAHKKKTGSFIYSILYPKRNTVLCYLMLEALKDYANGNADGLKYYAAINLIRLSEMDLLTRNNDEYRDLFYGTANYVDWMSRNSSASQYGQNILTKYTLDIKNPINNDETIIDYFDKMTKLVKHINEIAAPLVGIELDKSAEWSAQWKAEVESGTPMHELLLQHYSMTVTDAIAILELAKARYNYPLIEQEIDSVLNEADQTVKREMQAYNSDPGIEVVLDVPRDQVLDPEFTHGALLPIDKRQMLGLHLYGQVAIKYVNDNQTHLIRFDNIPRMFISEQAGANTRMVLRYKLPVSALLTIPGNYFGPIGNFNSNLNPARFAFYDSDLTFNHEKSSVTVPSFDTGVITRSNNQLKVTAVDMIKRQPRRMIY